MSRTNPGQRRSRRTQTFRCSNCKLDVSTQAPGTAHRNHCPTCLWSRHVDDKPGDRNAGCGARMEPVAVSTRRDGEWLIIHRCVRCAELHSNRIAGDDHALTLFALAIKPLARPPFPLDHLARL